MASDPALFPAVVIAASSGSLEPLRRLASGLPPGLPAAVLLAMHVDGAASPLPLLLSAAGPLPAWHPRDGEALKAGCIYVAPPDRHISVEGGLIRLTSDLGEHFVRPAADVLFRSAAQEFGPRAIGIVLSGEGKDGASGLAAIRAAGGISVVQAPHDAPRPSMPISAIAAVPPHHLVSADSMAPLIERLVQGLYASGLCRAWSRPAREYLPRRAPRLITSLHGLRVLVAEDRHLLAAMVARMLRDLGAEPIGPAPDVASGLRLLRRESGRIDCAVLDLDLGGEPALPLALTLLRAHVPVLFATGYSCTSLMAPWCDVPCLEKPFDARQLGKALLLTLNLPSPVDGVPPASWSLVGDTAEAIKETRNLLMQSRALWDELGTASLEEARGLALTRRLSSRTGAIAPDGNGHRRAPDQEGASYLQKILRLSIALTGANMGNVQAVDPTTGKLRIVAQQGFEKPFLDFFAQVEPGHAACGRALAARESVTVSEVTESPLFLKNRPALETLLAAGARAVHSRPILSQFGEPLGVLSTHFGVPHRPSEEDLRLLALCARQLATELSALTPQHQASLA